MNESPKPRRRRFSFTLRTMFIALTLIAATFGVRVNQVQRERNAVEAIRSLGGFVLYDDDGTDPNSGTHDASVSLKWPKEFVGLRKPGCIELTGKTVTDEFMQQHIIPLTSLHYINLHDVAITDKGLAQFKGLKALTSLRCIRDQRNEAVVRELNFSTNIEVKDISLAIFLEFLNDQHRPIRFTADTEALGAAGIDDITLITATVKVNTLNLGDALDFILRPYEMDWMIANGSLLLTTREIAKENRDRRTLAIEGLRSALPKLVEVEVD